MTEAILEMKGLWVRYPRCQGYAVAEIDLTVTRGEFVILAGKSASGKSTLMKAACGFIPSIIPARVKGRIKVDGNDDLELHDWARSVGMVHQDPEAQFCTRVVEEEVAFGPENLRFPEEEIEERVKNALNMVDAQHLRHRDIHTLSGGEKQKIAIASMLPVCPELLILDEPAANLDPGAMANVLDAIAGLREARPELSLVVVDHRITPYLDHATRLLYMEKGRITRDVRAKDRQFEPLTRAIAKKRSYPGVKRGLKENNILSIKALDYIMKGKDILKDINMEIREGEAAALMGPNGSGKTTLLRHITGLIPVQKGEIKVTGHRMAEGRKKEPWIIGRDVGLVWQNPNHQIFEDSIEGEMLFALSNFDIKRPGAVNELATFCQREGVEPGDSPLALSFGQKRRLNVLASSAHRPGLLLLDEPFTGQDRGNRQRLAAQLARLQNKGTSLLIVTHDQRFAREFCTKVFLLKKGKIIKAGEPESVINSGGFRGLWSK